MPAAVAGSMVNFSGVLASPAAILLRPQGLHGSGLHGLPGVTAGRRSLLWFCAASFSAMGSASIPVKAIPPRTGAARSSYLLWVHLLILPERKVLRRHISRPQPILSDFAAGRVRRSPYFLLLPHLSGAVAVLMPARQPPATVSDTPASQHAAPVVSSATLLTPLDGLRPSWSRSR